LLQHAQADFPHGIVISGSLRPGQPGIGIVHCC
jgi:hypothetical protein